MQLIIIIIRRQNTEFDRIVYIGERCLHGLRRRLVIYVRLNERLAIFRK